MCFNIFLNISFGFNTVLHGTASKVGPVSPKKTIQAKVPTMKKESIFNDFFQILRLSFVFMLQKLLFNELHKFQKIHRV